MNIFVIHLSPVEFELSKVVSYLVITFMPIVTRLKLMIARPAVALESFGNSNVVDVQSFIYVVSFILFKILR